MVSAAALPAGSPFDLILGLPVHPLVVHFAVVLLPLAAAGLIAIVLIQRWRGAFGWVVMAGLVAGFGAAFLAKESGEQLARRVGTPQEHVQWGDILPWVALALLVMGVVWFWLVRSAAKNPRGTSTLALNIAGGASIVLALVTIVLTIVVGHTGAQAVWGGRFTDASGAVPAPSASPRPTASASASASTGTSFTMQQVAQHNSPSDCWAVVDNNVYDLTSWINQHPGGPGPIEGMCGTDATTAFHGKHDGQTRPNETLATFQIGVLAG